MEPGVGSGVCGQWHVVAVPAVVRPGIALALLAQQCRHLAYGHSLRDSADRGHWLHCGQNTSWRLNVSASPSQQKPSAVNLLQRPRPSAAACCLRPARHWSSFHPARPILVSSSPTFRSKLKRRLCKGRSPGW